MPSPEVNPYSFIRPDKFEFIKFHNPLTGELETYAMNAKYDRVDTFPKIGAWIIKIYVDDVGLVGIHVGEQEALRVIRHTQVPLVERTFMYKSEHEHYLVAEARNLSDDILE